jgi:phosphatidylglycerol---prolipoprotein diacylglyceryl transferase
LLPGLLVTLLAVSLADFAAGPGFGKQAELLWSIDLFGVRRHPVQLYEIAAAGLAVVAWNRTRRTQHTPGHPTLLAAAVYSAARLFTDAYRANTPLTDGGYHLVQIASLGILLISLFLLTRRGTGCRTPDSAGNRWLTPSNAPGKQFLPGMRNVSRKMRQLSA